jgi:SAM-dependent methyltransferase
MINPLLFNLGMDAWLNDRSQDYIDFKIDDSKSLQEIAGYSNKPEINQTLDKIHALLQSTIFYDKLQRSKADDYHLLDIGCGPGLFLKDFINEIQIIGIDISKVMTDIAKKQLPYANIIHNHFLKHEFKQTFDAIYSVGVLIYFSKSQVIQVFKKIHSLLNDNGLVFISYPHAYRKADLGYPDFTYVHYSPNYLEKIVEGKFEIVYHKHVDGSRIVLDYDRSPIANPTGYENRTYQNSSILILRKR